MSNPTGLGGLKVPHTNPDAEVRITGAGTYEITPRTRSIVMDSAGLGAGDVVVVNFCPPEQKADLPPIFVRLVNKGALAIGNIQSNQGATFLAALKAALHTGTVYSILSNGFEYGFVVTVK